MLVLKLLVFWLRTWLWSSVAIVILLLFWLIWSIRFILVPVFLKVVRLVKHAFWC